jgi:ribosomal protein S4
MPSWLEMSNVVWRVIESPRREDSHAEIREGVIVEFYAR